jgi:hypothetical protein
MSAWRESITSGNAARRAILRRSLSAATVPSVEQDGRDPCATQSRAATRSRSRLHTDPARATVNWNVLVHVRGAVVHASDCVRDESRSSVVRCRALAVRAARSRCVAARSWVRVTPLRQSKCAGASCSVLRTAGSAMAGFTSSEAGRCWRLLTWPCVDCVEKHGVVHRTTATEKARRPRRIAADGCRSRHEPLELDDLRDR